MSGPAALTQTGNLLGALALAVCDRTTEAIAAAAGESESAAVALSAIADFLGEPSIDLLRQVLGLTSSGTVRLVDKLQSQRLVARQAGRDGRETRVQLTPAGRRAARKVAAARAGVLQAALAVLSVDERESLAGLLDKLLPHFVRRQAGPRGWMCRYCDTGACDRSQGRCPVANAAAQLFLTDQAEPQAQK